MKKIDDLGVFSITATWSVLAYIWLFVVLLDYEVKPWEAYLTFGLFWILLAMAVTADLWRRADMKRKEEERLGKLDTNKELTEDEKTEIKKSKTKRPADEVKRKNYEALDFYNSLLPLEKGDRSDDKDLQEKQREMQDFLMKEFGTTKVSLVDKDALKDKLGNTTMLLERFQYRK